MDYEKKYNEALERANKYNFDGAKQVVKDLVTYIFPELKENEDEKIRKAMIKGLSSCASKYWGGFEIKAAIAWLEKQGEQKPVNVDYISGIRKELLSIEDNAENINGLTESQWVAIRAAHRLLGEYIAKEQKPADKIEPKFHEGDWIISTLPGIKYPHLITDVRDGYYIFGEDNDHAHIASNDDVLKLWTIQDAKDGDVLAVDSKPFIYNGSKNEVTVGAYCGFNSEHKFSFAYNYVINQNITPATKEQRDLLFQKMKEAGYEWDDEKKELKKISQRMVSAEAKEALYDKPAWSEENEKMIGRIRSIVEKYAFSQSAVDVNGDLCEKEYIDVDNWLKSLKPQKSTGWNEEDEKRLKSCLNILQPKTLLGNVETINTKWLKSLKERHTWKPSDEQMEALFILLPTVCNSSPIFSLYNDLKKLIE